MRLDGTAEEEVMGQENRTLVTSLAPWIVWIVRAVFAVSICGAAVTGNAAYAPWFLITGLILLFVDGCLLTLLWPVLLAVLWLGWVWFFGDWR